MQSSITQMQKWFAKARDCRLRKCPGSIEIWSSQWIRTNKICSHWQFMPHKFGLTYGPWKTWFKNVCFVQMSVNLLPPLHFGGTRQTSRMLFLHFEQHPSSHFDRTWKKLKSLGPIPNLLLRKIRASFMLLLPPELRSLWAVPLPRRRQSFWWESRRPEWHHARL